MLQRQQHFLRSFEACFRIVRNGFQGYVFQPARDIRPVACGPHRLAKTRMLERLDLALRIAPRQQVIERDPRCVNIGAVAGGFTIEQFRRHEARRARVLHRGDAAQAGA